MTGISPPRPPLADSQLAAAIAAWVERAPPRVLTGLAEGEARKAAADALGEIIAERMAMVYPDVVESDAPPLPFNCHPSAI